jgi:hypothetical protein
MSVFEKTKKDLKDLVTDVKATYDAAHVEMAKPMHIQIPAGITPELAAYMNSQITSAVAQTVAAMSQGQNAMTAEGLASALTGALTAAETARRAPSETEIAYKKRQAREKKAMRDEEDANAANKKLTQDNCPHRYVNGQLAVAQVLNFHDRNPRFLCMKCHLLIQPRHWEVGMYPTEENPKGVDKIVDGHPLWPSICKEYAIAHPMN